MEIGVYEPIRKPGYSETGVAIPTESGIIGCMTIARREQIVGTRSSSVTNYNRPGSGGARRSGYPKKVDKWSADRKKLAKKGLAR